MVRALEWQTLYWAEKERAVRTEKPRTKLNKT